MDWQKQTVTSLAAGREQTDASEVAREAGAGTPSKGERRVKQGPAKCRLGTIKQITFT